MSRSMRIAVRPFGVLGSAMSSAGSVRKVAQGPVPGLAFVDPAGLPFIRNGPRGAGGAAGQIYKWLGIDDAFPAPVRDAIQRPLQAKLHYYGLQPCVHVVGPDFNGRSCSRDEALGEPRRKYYTSKVHHKSFRVAIGRGMSKAGTLRTRRARGGASPLVDACIARLALRLCDLRGPAELRCKVILVTLAARAFGRGAGCRADLVQILHVP